MLYRIPKQIFGGGRPIDPGEGGIFGGGRPITFSVTLPDGSATLVARILREGNSLTFQLVSKLNALDDTVFPEIQSWSDLNLISAVAILRYHNGTTEVTMVSGQDYDEVTTDELTLNTASLLSGGNFQVFLSDNSITGNKIDKFSVDIVLTS